MSKRVVIIGSFAESLVRFRGALIEDLLRCGHEVVACAPDIPDSVRQRLESMGARVQEIPMRRAGLNPAADVLLLFCLIRLLRRERPNILFSYTIKPVVYGGIAARLVGGIRFTPMITGLGYAFSQGKGFKQRLIGVLARVLYRGAMAGADRVFFQNPDDLGVFLAGRLIGVETQAQLVAGSGVDVREFAPSPPALAPVFLMIARLVVDKGVREYAQAARKVREHYPEARFLLAGWIDENPRSVSREELDGWIHSGDIEFLGKLQDVRPALQECSVYVLPSFYPEGTPRTILEALSCGRAVITTDSPGCRETVVQGVNGYLVPPRDATALAQRMVELIERPDLVSAFGRQSRAMAEDRFDVRKVNASILRGMGLAC